MWNSSSGMLVCSSTIEPRNHHNSTVFAVRVVYCSLMCSAEENLKLAHFCLVFAVEC